VAVDAVYFSGFFDDQAFVGFVHGRVRKNNCTNQCQCKKECEYRFFHPVAPLSAGGIIAASDKELKAWPPVLSKTA
jgi:hypothetical protein